MRNLIIFFGILITAVVDFCFSFKLLALPFPVCAALFFTAGWLLNTPSVEFPNKYRWLYLPFALFSIVAILINWRIWFILLVAPIALWMGQYSCNRFSADKLVGMGITAAWLAVIAAITYWLIPLS